MTYVLMYLWRPATISTFSATYLFTLYFYELKWVKYYFTVECAKHLAPLSLSLTNTLKQTCLWIAPPLHAHSESDPTAHDLVLIQIWYHWLWHRFLYDLYLPDRIAMQISVPHYGSISALRCSKTATCAFTKHYHLECAVWNPLYSSVWRAASFLSRATRLLTFLLRAKQQRRSSKSHYGGLANQIKEVGHKSFHYR